MKRVISEQARVSLDQVGRLRVFPRWWAQVPALDDANTGHFLPQIVQDGRGWPLPALRCEWHGRPVTPFYGFSLIQGIELTPSPSSVPYLECDVRALPYRPIPLGLILDTLFFASLWSLLLFVPRAIRCHLRRRRNLCPRCAYSLLNLPPNSPCPECGHNDLKSVQ